MSSTLFGALVRGDWDDYNKNGILPNIWKGVLGKNEDKALTDSTNQANVQMTNDTNLANKAMTDATNLANKEIARATNLSNRDIARMTNQANIDIANSTNEINKQIADENLGYQRELQEYNKALQQQIFEREDTSYQRTSKDMLAAGINPLSMQGTNSAGSIVSMSPLNNSYQAQIPNAMVGSTDVGATMTNPTFQAGHNEKASVNTFNSLMALANSIGGVMNAFDGVYTGQLQRDALALENDKKFLENFEKAHDLGIDYNFIGKAKRGKTGNISGFLNSNQPYFNYSSGSAWTKGANINREFNNKVYKGLFDSDMPFERAVTRIEKLLDNPEDLERRLKNLGKNSLSFLGGLFNTIK